MSMDMLFLRILNMSITASFIALAAIILRFFLRKSPRWISCLLWGLVAIRLLIPFSFESHLSLMPEGEPIPTPAALSEVKESPAENSPESNIYNDYREPLSDNEGNFSGVVIPDNNVNIPENTPEASPEIMENEVSNSTQTQSTVSATTVKEQNGIKVLKVLSWVWVSGVALMALYCTLSYLKIKRKVKISLLREENIYYCDEVKSPFILGLIKPKIYLPSNITEEDAGFVIAHEKAHLKRRDHLIKPLGFLLLTIHWFNPLMWVCYILLSKDIELAREEKVIRDMEIKDKKSYSTTLLSLSVKERMISACPLAFGEVSVKERIKSVLSYKKPAFWVSVVAIILCITLGVCFLTNPVEKQDEGEGAVADAYEEPDPYITLPEDTSGLGYIEYAHFDNETILKDSYVKLYPDTERFELMLSPLSSYLPTGTYTITEDKLTLDCEGNEKMYVFTFTSKDANSLKFVASESSEIPKYKYSEKDKNSTSVFEDGAIFTHISGEVENLRYSSHTEIDGVWVEFSNVDLFTYNYPTLGIHWYNETDTDYSFGEYFELHYFRDGEWIDCKTGLQSANDIAYVLRSGDDTVYNYYLSGYDISRVGKYRFTTEIEHTGKYTWVVFSIGNQGEINFTEGTKGTDTENVSVTVKKIDLSPDNPYMEVEWTNYTDKTIDIRDEYEITKSNGQSFEYFYCSLEKWFYQSLKELEPYSTFTYRYSLSGYAPFEPGDYRFEGTYDKGQKASMEIRIGSRDVIKYSFEADDLVYACDRMSKVTPPEKLPSYRLTNHGTFEVYDSENKEWITLGNAQKFHIYSNKLDSLFTGEGRWIEALSTNDLKSDNGESFETNTKDSIYMLLKQKNGSLYLVIADKTSADTYNVQAIYRQNPDVVRTTMSFDLAMGDNMRFFTSPSATATLSMRDRDNDATNKLFLENRNVSGVENLYDIFRDGVYTISDKEHSDSVVSITLRDYDEAGNPLFSHIDVYEDDLIKIYDSTYSHDQLYHSVGITEKATYAFESLKTRVEPYYKCIYGIEPFMYSYEIRSKMGLLESDTIGREPHFIHYPEDDLVAMWVQAGTGTLTRSQKFYNTETGEISQVFTGLVDYKDGLVLSSGHSQVTITSLENPEKTQVIDTFKEPISPHMENICAIGFTEDGARVKVTYNTGDYEKGEEISRYTEYFEIDQKFFDE